MIYNILRAITTLSLFTNNQEISTLSHKYPNAQVSWGRFHYEYTYRYMHMIYYLYVETVTNITLS